MRKVSWNSNGRHRGIRKTFMDFFSSPNVIMSIILLVPSSRNDDPTLLFINAGMNQYKSIFRSSRPFPSNGKTKTRHEQSEMHPGGKHNDSDDVGKTYHHTFFEMLATGRSGHTLKN
jgi:alanyl-tRNA synthetase